MSPYVGWHVNLRGILLFAGNWTKHVNVGLSLCFLLFTSWLGTLCTEIGCLKDKFSPYFQHSRIRHEKNVVLYHITVLWMALMLCMFVLILDVKQSKTCCVADVMPHLWPWQMVKPVCTIHGCYAELVKEFGRAPRPGCAMVVHIVPPCDRDVMFNYIMYAPCVCCQGYSMDTYY